MRNSERYRAAERGRLKMLSADGITVRAFIWVPVLRFSIRLSITTGDRDQVRGTDDVGELGTNMIAANNEIAWNNYAGYDYQWEAGGSKFLFTSGLIVEGNYVPR